jgi:hypothetical protein
LESFKAELGEFSLKFPDMTGYVRLQTLTHFSTGVPWCSIDGKICAWYGSLLQSPPNPA